MYDYDILNAVLRGLISALGAGGGITCEVFPVRARFQVSEYATFLSDVAVAFDSIDLFDGDVMVITSSIISLAQKRLVPRVAIPKEAGVRGEIPALMNARQLEECASSITNDYGLRCSSRDILLSDTACIEGRDVVLLAPDQPNLVAFDLASLFHQRRGIACDVVVKDSDAGRCAEAIIGCPTLVATPLGATRGLSILEAIRVAAAAEVLMGKKNGVPIVLCRPANDVVRRRAGIGERRNAAFLDAGSEPLASSEDQRE